MLSEGAPLLNAAGPWMWGIAIYVLVTGLSVAIGVRVVLTLPITYFVIDEVRYSQRPATWSGRLGRLARNALGLVLVLIGVLLSIPGIPGQGVLTILIGVLLLDFPGRRRAERRLIGVRGVLEAVNRLRGWFRRPPLAAPPSTCCGGD